MRYVVYGAGAVGGTIGARLHEHGHEVVLIARGRHLEAMRRRGLRLQRPDADDVFDVAVAAAPGEVGITADDVVILTMKTQDTDAALGALAAVSPPEVPFVCAQNGVENERLALRRHQSVYAMCVKLPATHLEPGVVQASGSPVSGILEVGRYPSGSDDLVDRIVADLGGSGFVARAHTDVMRLKYHKLLMNLANATEAVCGRAERRGELARRARQEAAGVLAAAGIAVAGDDESRRDAGLMRMAEVAGEERSGGSTWQSLARGTGSTEVDYLNGEIILLGRLHGIATPVNELLRQEVHRLTREERRPGTIPAAELLARL